MKFGCCVNMLPGVKHLAGAKYFDTLAELGYDYVEIPLNMLSQLSDDEVKQVRAALRSSGLPCRTCNDFMPTSYQIVGSDLTPREEIKRYLKRAFYLIGQEGMGADYTVFGSPWSRSCPDGFDKETAFCQIEDFLLDAAVLAEQNGITIVLEAINHTETNMINRLPDALRLVRHANHPNIKALCDYYHIRMEEDHPSVVLDGGELIAHTHIAKRLGRSYFTDCDDEAPMVYQFADALRSMGYDGGMSLEARPSSEEAWKHEAALSLAELHRIFD